MTRARHLYITYADLRIKVIVNNHLYTLLFPDTSSCTVERNAAGWLKADHQEPHWADKDIAIIGQVIEKKVGLNNL